MVEGGVLKPAEKRTREEIRDTKICHQARQKAAGCDAGADRRSGEKQIKHRSQEKRLFWSTGLQNNWISLQCESSDKLFSSI